MKSCCRRCTHWTPLPLAEGHSGLCKRITQHSTDSSLAVVQSDLGEKVEFITRPDFGCVLFEVKGWDE